MAKTKYIAHYCAYCRKETKMEVVGGKPDEGSEAPPQKVWYRCTRCKHSALFDAVVVSRERNGSLLKIERSDCIEYSKDKTFPVGQAIYHVELDDMGKVIRKDKASSGIQTIIVSFEKLGERRLIENLTTEPSF